MAMTINPATLAKSLIRGEAISYDFGLNDPDGNPEVLKDRIIALAIYQGEEMLGFLEGTYVPAAEGGRDLVSFMLTGAQARELFGKRPSYDLLEVLDDGSDTLAQGTINILPGSPRIVDLDSAPIARTRLRVIRTAPKLVTDAATFTVEIVRSTTTAPPVTPPATDNLLDFSSAAGSQYIGLF